MTHAGSAAAAAAAAPPAGALVSVSGVSDDAFAIRGIGVDADDDDIAEQLAEEAYYLNAMFTRILSERALGRLNLNTVRKWLFEVPRFAAPADDTDDDDTRA